MSFWPATFSTTSHWPTDFYLGSPRLAKRGANIIVGDPGRSYFPKDLLESLAVYSVPVTRVLEDAEVKQTTVWRFRR